MALVRTCCLVLLLLSEPVLSFHQRPFSKAFGASRRLASVAASIRGGSSDEPVPVNGNDPDDRDINFVPGDVVDGEDEEEEEEEGDEGDYTEAVLDTDPREVLKEAEMEVDVQPTPGDVSQEGEEVAEEEYFHDALEEEDGEEEVLPQRLLDRLEEAADQAREDDGDDTIGRMELADAYDDGETTAGETPADDGIPEDVTEITPEMEKTLIKDLNYSRKDVSAMKPAMAAYVIAKGLSKPLEGMPLSFYLPGKEPQPKKALDKLERRSKVKKIITSAVTLAIGGAIIAVAIAMGDTKSSLSVHVPTTPQDEPASVYEIEPVEEPVEEIAPPPRPVPASQPKPLRMMTEEERRAAIDALDVTWLDKAITKVERAIKSFFRIKI